ncbi:MAG: hypothetical protein IKL49_08690 [Lachnospiraceae bacterium]|nr:hypothetical protein [Lachnospiraceae bacterium]
MKSKRMKMFPLILMLVAGSFTSIMTYYFQYEIKTALLVLLSVLLVFYLLGLLLVNVIVSFDKKNEEERKAKEKEEGIVLEKDNAQEEVVEK